ncbi:hypothetical protein P2318_29590 [Myxococcaceae bacterium GXIMD 01537]
MANSLRSELLDDVFFTRWGGSPSVEDVREMEVRLAQAKQRARGPLIHVAVIPSRHGTPTEALDIDPLLRASHPHAGVLYLMFEVNEPWAADAHRSWLLLEGAQWQGMLERDEPHRVETHAVIAGRPVVTRLARDAMRPHEGLAELAADLGHRLRWDGEDLLRRAREHGLLS